MTSFPSERRLREDLRAIRHLPPGIHLNQPLDPKEQILLSEILELPDEVDPLHWVRANRSLVAAMIALKSALQQIKQLAVGLARSRREGLNILADLQLMLGGLVRLPERAEPFIQLGQVTDFSPELLRSLLQKLRELRGDSTGVDLSLSAISEYERLLVELLDLPESTDPVHWLHSERSAIATHVALSDILEQCRPARTLEVGSMIRHRHLREVLQTPKGTHVMIKEAILGTNGFVISANVRLSTRLVARLTEAKQISSLIWLGFDRVVDDQGFHYLLQGFKMEVGSSFLWGWRRERLHLAFYPAVAEGSTALTFIANPMTLEASRWVMPDPQQLLPTFQSLPALDLGDITWIWSIYR